MNKQFVLSVVVLFVATMLTGFIVHGYFLHDDSAKLVPGVVRTPTDAREHCGYMIVADIVMAIGLTWMYRQGRDNRPWPGQGVRFGLAVTTLMVVPWYLIYFAVQPMPSDVVAKQIVLGGIATVILGVIAAFMNRGGTIPGRS